jgi:hypothetical protein
VSERHASPARRSARRHRPLLVLLPFLFGALALLHLLQRPRRGDPAPPPSQSDPGADVAAWRGELVGARGAWLEARLSPLHADPERQDFEARTLRRRLDLEEGRAWRLRVLWSAPRATQGAAAGAPLALGERGPGGAEPLASAEPSGIGLGAVEVVDDAGVAARSLPPPESGTDAHDPLRVLLAPPPGALRPGQAADWILWGRAPRPGATLRGLVPGHDADFLAATGFSGRLELRGVSLRRDDLDEPLARLERPEVDPRKSAREPASEVARDGEDEH